MVTSSALLVSKLSGSPERPLTEQQGDLGSRHVEGEKCLEKNPCCEYSRDPAAVLVDDFSDVTVRVSGTD